MTSPPNARAQVPLPASYDVMWQGQPIVSLPKKELIKIILAFADEIDQIRAATQRLSSVGYTRGRLVEPAHRATYAVVPLILGSYGAQIWAILKDGKTCSTHDSQEEANKEMHRLAEPKEVNL